VPARIASMTWKRGCQGEGVGERSPPRLIVLITRLVAFIFATVGRQVRPVIPHRRRLL
jgi:hypothetical protein